MLLISVVSTEIMTIKYFSAYENLQRTICSLSVGQGKLKERLANAYSYHLMIIHPEYMPEHLQQELSDIQNKLTKNHTKTVEETIRYWKKSKTLNIATDIFYLFCRMSYYYHSGGKM